MRATSYLLVESVTLETVRVPGAHFITHSVLTIQNVGKTCQRFDIMHTRIKMLSLNRFHGKKQKWVTCGEPSID